MLPHSKLSFLIFSVTLLCRCFEWCHIWWGPWWNGDCERHWDVLHVWTPFGSIYREGGWMVLCCLVIHNFPLLEYANDFQRLILVIWGACGKGLALKGLGVGGDVGGRGRWNQDSDFPSRSLAVEPCTYEYTIKPKSLSALESWILIGIENCAFVVLCNS